MAAKKWERLARFFITAEIIAGLRGKGKKIGGRGQGPESAFMQPAPTLFTANRKRKGQDIAFVELENSCYFVLISFSLAAST